VNDDVWRRSIGYVGYAILVCSLTNAQHSNDPASFRFYLAYLCKTYVVNVFEMSLITLRQIWWWSRAL